MIQVKQVILFVTSWCPHCRNAERMLRELIQAHPEYGDIAIDIIDEEKNKKFSDSFDYYFVPTFYVGGKKMHEGVPTREKIEAVLKSALE